MQWRFYTERGTVDQETLETVLSDHESAVGIVEFGKTFRSVHVHDIHTRGQALALKRLLAMPNVQIERIREKV